MIYLLSELFPVFQNTNMSIELYVQTISYSFSRFAMKEKRYKKVEKCIEEIDLCDLQCVFYDIKVGTTGNNSDNYYICQY
jgi:hypothetical protein